MEILLVELMSIEEIILGKNSGACDFFTQINFIFFFRIAALLTTVNGKFFCGGSVVTNRKIVTGMMTFIQS